VGQKKRGGGGLRGRQESWQRGCMRKGKHMREKRGRKIEESRGVTERGVEPLPKDRKLPHGGWRRKGGHRGHMELAIPSGGGKKKKRGGGGDGSSPDNRKKSGNHPGF